jgi:hypothetical protein
MSKNILQAESDIRVFFRGILYFSIMTKEKFIINISASKMLQISNHCHPCYVDKYLLRPLSSDCMKILRFVFEKYCGENAASITDRIKTEEAKKLPRVYRDCIWSSRL